MTLNTYWQQLHRWPRAAQWSLKAVFLGVTVALVLYPKVWLIPTWVGRLRDLNSVVDANAPQIDALQARVLKEVGEGVTLAGVLRPVECAVCDRIPYAFDWDTWGVMDYMPTVAEVFAKGREDCDGRAVVAASLLRRLGYDAWLVTDLKHTWVVARDEGAPVPTDMELMGPGLGEKTLSGTPGAPGTRLRVSVATVANLVRGTAFGVAVFPLGREVVILAAVCAVALQPQSSLRRRIAGCVLLAGALWLLRAAGTRADALAARPPLDWAGLALVLAGCLSLVIKAGAVRSESVQSE